MSQTLYKLADRGVISIEGADARTWLDSLVTNDLTGLDHKPAVFSALLSPQGKLLFEFFLIKECAGLLLDTARDAVAPMIKRLTLYKLRAQVAITDVSAERGVVWAPRASSLASAPTANGALLYPDPRAESQLWRGITAAAAAASLPASGDYAAQRVRLGLPEPPIDYRLGDAFPHEANFDLLQGVSFTKGCFVGQEVVSRMQNKTVVRKRIARVIGRGPLRSGLEITAGTATLGTLGTVAGDMGLAMLRLDRAAEAQDAGQALMADRTEVEIDAAALASYRQSVANRPVHDL